MVFPSPSRAHRANWSECSRPPNTRVQRTRSSPSALRSPLTRHPLGRARGRRSLNDPCELAPRGSGGYQGAQEQVESDSRIGSLHLRHTRLAGANELGKASLGQMSGFSPQAKAAGEHQPEFDELGFLLGEPQELIGRTNLPAGGLEFLPFRGFHRSPHVFVVVLQSPSAVVNNEPGRGGCLLVEDLENQYGVALDPVDDSPGVVAIPNPKFVATGPDRSHRARLRKTQSLALLKSPQEISGFDSRRGGKRRSLDLALSPCEGFFHCPGERMSVLTYCQAEERAPPNTRVQRTRSSPSALRSPLTRHPLGLTSYVCR